MPTDFDNSSDVIDSRTVIERIEEIQSEIEGYADDQGPDLQPLEDAKAELAILEKLAEEAGGSPDWIHGETLIRESYFTDYIRELIHDCYSFPKEFESGDWPWRHMTLDYEAAAEEAKADYIEADYDGITYLIRA